MHGIGLLHNWLTTACSFMHLGRVGAVVAAVGALLDRGAKLSLSHLGRHLDSAAFRKHSIKRMDRLLGNGHLHTERVFVYQAMARWVLKGQRRPVILVDWSDCAPGHQYLMLKAAVPAGGRALTLYEEVHPLSAYNSRGVHQAFLVRLKAVLPGGCRPIVVSDAGFRGPWFRAVERLGWDWVGRVRNKVKYRLEGTEAWRYTTELYAQAAPAASYLGAAELSAQRPHRAHLHLLRAVLRTRSGKRRRDANTQRCRKMYRDPWLIATSLSPEEYPAPRVMKLYKLRMQIEESFRDLKGHRWGLGLEYARSRSVERLEVLLLIGALAALLLWLTGLAARLKGWARHFQANTVTDRTVLSMGFLGKEVLKTDRFEIRRRDLTRAMKQLRIHIQQQVLEA